jgi:hypothetical protein
MNLPVTVSILPEFDLEKVQLNMLAGSFSRSHSGGAATVTSRFKDFSNLL